MNCNRMCESALKEGTCFSHHEEQKHDCIQKNGVAEYSSDLIATSNSCILLEKDYGKEEQVRNHDKQSFVLDMIDGYDGAQKFEFPLLNLNGGSNLSFKISYDSSQISEGVLGIGWSHCFEKSLVVEGETAYLYERPNVYHLYRRWEHDNMFWGRTMGRLGYQLFETRDGYRLECNYNPTEYYNQKGQLSGIKDRNGREVRILHYESRIMVTDMLTMKGIFLDLDETGKLIRVYDGENRTVEFNYENGRLTEIFDVNGKYHFYTYDSAGRMVSAYNDERICLYTNTYDEDGRIVCREDGMNRSVSLIYSDNQRFITDRNGNQYQLTFNRHGLLASRTDANGNSYSYTYTINGNPETITDANGNKTTVEYLGYYKPWRYIDKNGNQTEFAYERENISKITYSDGTYETFSWNYKNLMVEHRDLRGTVTSFSYDENKNLILKKIGSKKTIRYSYENGLPVSETDAKGYTVRYKYNEFGQMIARVDAAERPTIYEYDLSGKLLKVTDPIGSSTSYAYDCNDQLCSVTDANGNCTTYFYNNNRKLEKIVFADHTTILLEYDAEDQLIKCIDQGGNETRYNYDPAGRLISVQASHGDVTQYHYDAAGKLIKEVQANGAETSYTYDPLGNLLTVTDANGNMIRYQYDGKSRVIREVNGFGGTTFFQYSPAGDLLSTRDPFGYQTSYTYDDYGNQISICDPRGNTTRYAYDGNDNLIAMTDPFGNNTFYEYNSYNRPIKKTNQKNQKEQYLYDAVGRFIGMTDAKENFINIYYDIVGNLQTLRDAKRNELFKIQYDSMNRPISILDVFGNETTYRYDDLGRLKCIVDPQGNEKEFSKEPAKISAGRQETAARNVFYDLAGRIVAYGDADDSVSITYDENGNIKTIADKNGVSIRQYDALNRLIRYTAPNGKTIGYRYDSVGNVTAIIYPDQSEVLYNYDANNNLISVTDWAGRNTWYLYDANNRVIGVSKPNEQVVTFIYDEAGQMISKETGVVGGETRSNFEYEYDELGRIQSEKETIKNQTKRFTYDEHSRIVMIAEYDANDELCSEQTFSYDEFGNMTVMNGSEIFIYDNKNRLIAHNGESISYDSNGNVLTAVVNGAERSFEYDFSNRLISADEDRYFYDAENNCIRIQSGKIKKELLYDVRKPQKPLLMMTVNGIETKFVYGLGLIGSETNGEFQTYLFDRQGNTISIVCNDQTDRFEYDVFGKCRHKSETALPPFLYKGYDGFMTLTDDLYFKHAHFYCDEFSQQLNSESLFFRMEKD